MNMLQGSNKKCLNVFCLKRLLCNVRNLKEKIKTTLRHCMPVHVFLVMKHAMNCHLGKASAKWRHSWLFIFTFTPLEAIHSGIEVVLTLTPFSVFCSLNCCPGRLWRLVESLQLLKFSILHVTSLGITHYSGGDQM